MPDVHAITSAGRSHTDQLRDRTRNYLISMGIRTAAFVAAVFTEGWVRWVCVGLAFVLPYIAVLMANSGAERRTMPSTYLDDHALEAAPTDRTEDADRAGAESGATGRGSSDARFDHDEPAGLRDDVGRGPTGPTGASSRLDEPPRTEQPR